MINYNLIPFERAFAFQIISQDPKVDSFMKSTGIFFASNGWKIKLAKVPEVNVFSKTIYLQGSNPSKDFRIDRTWNLPSNSSRDAIINEVSNAISELISSVNANISRWTTYGITEAFPLVYRDWSSHWAFINPTSEVESKWSGKFDSEGWGPNKLNPNKETVIVLN